MHTSSTAHACPISGRRSPHQQPMHTLQHLTMQQHMHAHQHHMHSASAPHTHIHLQTPNIKSRGSMLKNKDLNFKALIQKTKTQSESLSPHSTMSTKISPIHTFMQIKINITTAQLYKSKHNPISTKEKKIQSMYPQIFLVQNRSNRSLARRNKACTDLKIFNKLESLVVPSGFW